MKSASLKKIGIAALAVSVAGCTTTPGQEGIGKTISNTFNNPDPCANNARNTGILLGVVAGAIVGAKLGDKDRGAMLAGALLGSTVGGLIGADIDQRRCELAKVASQYDLQMRFAAVTSSGAVVSDTEMNMAPDRNAIKKNAIGHIVSLQDGGGHFESNSAVLTSRAEQYFSAIADIYNLNKAGGQAASSEGVERKLLLVGHTDDTGSSAINAELSERRARAVGEYLERRGIPRDQVFYQGAGEVYPAADNNTEAGRLQNRRVEIVELSSTSSLHTYLEARRPMYRYYRAATDASERMGGNVQTVVPRPGGATARPNSQSGATGSLRSVPTQAGAIAMAAAKTALPRAQPNPAGPRSTVSRSVAYQSIGKPIDFGGAPLPESRLAATKVGVVQGNRPLFSLISAAYANDLPVISECSQDRPRLSGAVRALKDGASYKVAEHVPGLYGKTWTQRVNGHQVVVNKVAVLASEASLAQIPELKVYADYDPAKNRNPQPDVSLRPEVNTYLGEGGILYRIFTNGVAGMQCIDILYSRNGGASAKDGNIVYARNNQLYVSPFKPVIAN